MVGWIVWLDSKVIDWIDWWDGKGGRLDSIVG